MKYWKCNDYGKKVTKEIRDLTDKSQQIKVFTPKDIYDNTKYLCYFIRI